MAARVYAGGCLTPLQSESLESPSLRSYSCSSAQVNTCGMAALEAITQYGLYDPKVGYGVGNRVIVLSSFGGRYDVYEAKEDIVSPAGVFNLSLWDSICSISPTGKDGLTISNYGLISAGSYVVGDRRLRNTNCGDHTCVYESLGSFSLTESEAREVPDSQKWKLLYCLRNGEENRCAKSFTCGNFRTQPVLLSKAGDIACVPIADEEYIAYPKAGTLFSYVEDGDFILAVSGGSSRFSTYLTTFQVSADNGISWEDFPAVSASPPPSPRIFRAVVSDKYGNTKTSNTIST